ncbi:MAG TPA: glycoside hydrolase family 16 protein, partial [Saprospiraceae bacterium]|nr:glycoside hydrolase family 16 protein [Saprospiraceae bacterium]
MIIPFIIISQNHKSPTEYEGWELVWNDEFNGSGLPDSSKWNYDVGGHGWGNNEKQYYLAKSIENTYLRDGKLHIVAVKKDYENRSYTSAKLTTYNKINQKYGKVEVKAKLP